ncbi:hypothetical protein [Mesorhizobium sp. ISC11]|uniref:hypothetical protein n=1 Tax=Mesorhizobium sp. ISC11 TaxID=3076428 RepID=UPI00301CF4A1
MILDRDLQLKMLNHMAASYPQRVKATPFEGGDSYTYFANLQYLCEHGLAEALWSNELSGRLYAANARITAAGMDFLADDGGLSAILGVVTIRFHEDTVKALLIDRVEKSDVPATVRSKLVDQIKALPAEATKALTLEAIKAGLANVPEFLTWLQTTLRL